MYFELKDMNDVGGEIEVRVSGFPLRSRRNMTLEERGQQCKALELSKKTFSTISDVLGDINSIPGIKEITGIVTAGASIVTHLTAGGLDIAQTALDCADVPFDEIKELMKKKFNEMDRKLDSHSAALEAVSRVVNKTLSLVEKTRKEMNERFDEVLVSIENTKIAPIVSKINNFVRYFETEKERMRGLPKNDYVAKLQEKDSLLLFLRDSRTPKNDGSLNSALFDIIKHGYAIPHSNKDQIAFKALYSLLYGTEAHVSVMTFLMEQYSYLANYHYQRGEIDQFKESFDAIHNIFLDFKSSLVGEETSKSEPLLDQVIQVLNDVIKVEFLRLERDDIIQMLNDKIETFSKVTDDIRNMVLTITTDTPNNYVHLSFDTDIAVPIGEWQQNKKVSYAVQYQNEKSFARIGDWSEPVTISDHACPTLRFGNDPTRNNVVIFRKFQGSKPQLVGSYKSYQQEFTDIDRDLYNAAGNPDSKTGTNEAKILLSKGAKVSIGFERGRRVLHETARSGNTDIAMDVVVRGHLEEINAADAYGYTPMHIAADRGNAGFVKFLINLGGKINAKTNRIQSTPLHIAARRGFRKTIRILLESPDVQINERNKEGFTPLHYAVWGGKFMVEEFIKNTKIEINPKSTIKELTPFHLAVINNDIPVAQALLGSSKVEINAGDKSNMTPLHYTAMLGHIDMMQHLLSLSGIKINVVTKDNKWSPLHYAIFFKHDNISLRLLSAPNLDDSLKADGDITPLHFAVTFGRKSILIELLKRKVNLEAVTRERYTPLHLAAMRKDTEILSILLDKGANIEARTTNESTPLHVATFNGRAKTALTLLERGADFSVGDINGQTPIHGAAQNDQLDVIRALLTRDANIIEIKNKNLDTPLNVAAQYFHTAVAKYLINKRADVNTRNIEGISPLLAFAKVGNLDMVKYLINNGADVYITDNNGINFIYHAIRNDHLNIVEYAIGLRKIDWNKIDDKRKEGCPSDCPIEHFAVCDSLKYGKLDIVTYFIGTLNKNICEPLHVVSRFGWLDIVKYLVEEIGMKVDPKRGEFYYNTPLCNAAIGGHLGVVKYLVQQNAKLDLVCEYTEYAIDFAIKYNHLNVVKFLSENGANLKKKNRNGLTPLYSAFLYNKFEIVKYFVEEKTKYIDINERDRLKNTPLITAVYFGRLDVVKSLVENGADVGAKNNDGKTALDLARSKGVSDIIQYLESRNKRFIQKVTDNIVSYFNFPSDSKQSKGIEFENQKYAYLGGKTRRAHQNNESVQNVDVIGTLLLLDVIVRYFTNQKYISEGDQPTSEAAAQATALKITENFEELLAFFKGVREKDQIDFSEVHKNIYKAIKSGKESQIHKILCSAMKTLNSLTMDEMEQIMVEFNRKQSAEAMPEDRSVSVPVVQETHHFLAEHCFENRSMKLIH